LGFPTGWSFTTHKDCCWGTKKNNLLHQLAISCYDFILGVDFLSTLGPILWDLDVLSLIFWREGGRRVQWTGIGGSGAATPQLQLMAATLDEAHPLLADLLQ
jgi:hypothetical protein